jgi:hypothetical protein
MSKHGVQMSKRFEEQERLRREKQGKPVSVPQTEAPEPATEAAGAKGAA